MNKPHTLDELPLVFGPYELAGILGISRNNAYDLVNSAGFPSTKVGRKHIISKTHFIKWLDEEINKKV